MASPASSKASPNQSSGRNPAERAEAETGTLTLRLDVELIKRSEAYAKGKGTSLAQLVAEILAERVEEQPLLLPQVKNHRFGKFWHKPSPEMDNETMRSEYLADKSSSITGQ